MEEEQILHDKFQIELEMDLKNDRLQDDMEEDITLDIQKKCADDLKIKRDIKKQK